MMKRLAAIALAAMICAGAGIALGETTMHREVDDPAIEMTAEIGYQGMMTYGKAMPLRVHIRNNGAADLEGKLGINAYASQQQYNRFEMNISVPSGAEQEFVLPFSVMYRQEIFTPEITVDGKVAEAVNITIQANQLINPSSMLVGVLSTKPRKLSAMNINAENDTEYLGEYWQTIALDADSFPDQAALLDAFGLLVIDDVDPASLSSRQQEVLKQWMEGRHVLLCSGTMAATAYFSDRTGLEITGASTSRQVLSVLEKQIGINSSGIKKAVAVSQMSGAAPLVSDDQGNGLIFRTETGNGRIYTTAFEMGESGLFSERTMRYFWRKMLVANDRALYNGIFYPYYYSNSVATVYPGTQISVPVRSPMTAVTLIAAGVPALGCALWFVLKKTGRQTWMWLALPGMAAAAAAAILVISGGSDLNRPMVTYVDHVLQRDDGSATRYIGINAASSATGMHTYRISGAPISVEYTQDYYYYDDGEEPSEPVEMAMCYTTGEEEQLTVKAETPWEIKTMRSEGPLNMGGRVEADIWMQEDGLHGLVRNNTSLALKEGVVITTYGFVSVPALQPGESASFAILEAPRNSADSGPADGVMSRSAGYTLYTVTNAALGLSDDSWDVSGPASMRREIINAAMNRLTDGNYYSSDQTAFLYSAEAENPLPLAFYADGKQVENAAGMSVFNIEINYLPVGKTGVIYRMPGMDQAVRMTTDEFGKPAEVADDGFPRDDYYSKYHDLSENPVFRFIPECPKGVRITSMSISVPYYDAQVRCFLLNAVTGEWDEIRVNQNIKNPEQYLDENGQLFCRFEPAVRTEYGVDIPTPGLSLEGRDPNAEN